MQLAPLLIVCAATVAGMLGCIHMVFTFRGTKLHPRDPAVRDAMMATNPFITRQTTVWRATQGFNASHSLGIIVFSVFYIFLAGWHPVFLLQSTFLLALGLGTLLAYLVLAKAYWFSIPFRGVALASALYAAGLVVVIAG